MPALLPLIALFFAIFVLLGYKRRPKNYPPGPLGLPYIGNIFQLGLKAHINSLKLVEKYGDIVGLRIGFNWVVLLNNGDDAREGFSRPEFSGRPAYNGFHEKLSEEANYGIILSTGKTWVEHRRFTLRTLRDFGFGKRSLEAIIMEEVRELISRLKQSCGQPIETSQLFNVAIFNVIWSMVAGQRYHYDDPKLTELMHLVTEFFKSGSKPRNQILFMFPKLIKLKTIFPFLFPKQEGDIFREKVFEFFRIAIAEHEATLQEGNPRDLIDSYLEEVKKTQDPSSSFFPDPKHQDLPIISTLLDLFAAGSETTSTTLVWTYFLLAQHHSSQDRLAKEIHSLVGSREVLLEDRPQLPYVEATIMEIMRMSSLAALGVPHATTEDTTLKGYFLPKDTVVMGNIYASHFSSSIWGDPDNFRPERFLDANQKVVIRNKAWMPFSVGKRQCMGESLARDELFLFFTNLVHNFEITMPHDEPEHSLVGVLGGVLHPEPHKIILRARNNHYIM